MPVSSSLSAIFGNADMVVVISAVPVTIIGLVLHNRVDDIVDQDVPAQVDDTVAVGLQHDSGDVLADVVGVSLSGVHDNGALYLPVALQSCSRRS